MNKIIASNGYIGITYISSSMEFLKIEGHNKGLKIYYSIKRGAYFNLNKKRYYLDEFIRTDLF